MNARRISLIAWKTLVELIREPRIPAFTLLTPLIFLLIVIFGYTGVLPRTHTIHVMRNGDGPAATFRDLEAAAYPDGRRVFDVVSSESGEEGRAAVDAGSADLFVMLSDSAGTGTTEIYGNPVSPGFMQASAELERTILDSAGKRGAWVPPAVIEEVTLSVSGTVRESDAFLPGMTVFALLLLIPQTALLLGREVRLGTLKRLGLSSADASDLFIGIAAGQLGTALALVIVMYAATRLFSGKYPGDFTVYLFSGMILSFSSIGQGLFVACFVENDSQAVNVGGAVSMVQVFLSGAFFPISLPSIGSIAGYVIEAGDFLPAVYCMTALREAMLYGSGPGETWFRLLCAFLFSIVFFFTGVTVFRKKADGFRY